MPAAFYWQGKMPAANHFNMVPFGRTPNKDIAWIEAGALRDELWRPHAPPRPHCHRAAFGYASPPANFAPHETHRMRGFSVTLALLLAAQPLSVAAENSSDLTVCRTAREPERGIEACSRVIAQGAEPRAVLAQALDHRGRFYGRTGQRDLALADFTRAIALEPDNPSAYKTRGAAYHGARDFDSALADYSQAIRLDAQDADAYRARGDTRLSARQYEEARADYAAAIRLKPPRMDSAGQCQVSASLANAFFHCTRVVLDAAQSADIRAEAQKRLDRMSGAGTPR